MRDALLVTLSTPFVAAIALALGWLGIVVEFLRPGSVIPGALGGVLAVVGLWSLVPDHPATAIAVLLPCGALTAVLLMIAARARRNKTSA